MTNDDFTVLAIVAAFNEEDVIEAVIRHLVDNQVGVYLIDNGSTDGTVEAASPWVGRGLLAIERFASDARGRFDWEAILRRKEAIAREFPASWYVHHDADEIREGPWPSLNLKRSIEYVDSLGFNCIDFHLLHFRATDDGFRRGTDPADYFLFYEDAEEFDRLQLKCWKAGVDVDLASSGGHEAQFDGRQIFPIKFLLRHYPIRGFVHGQRKVFEERLPRFREEERDRGWHVQYDCFSNDGAKFVFDKAELKLFDREALRLELMLHNRLSSEQERAIDTLASIGVEIESESPAAAARLKLTLVELRASLNVPDRAGAASAGNDHQ